MVNQNKILTVSYGTFSCTLEGFEDPFGTMRAIAEYFRDLAAEDRYFGAEPPQPDAAMLHRIAEREVQRRVEARIEEHGVILRTGDAVAPPVPDAAARPPSVPAAQAVAPRVSESSVEESVAAKLARIRAAVGRARAPLAPSFDDTAEDAPVDLPAMAPAPAAEEPAPVAAAEPAAQWQAEPAPPAEAPENAQPADLVDVPPEVADPAVDAPTEIAALEARADGDIDRLIDTLSGTDAEAEAVSAEPAEAEAEAARPAISGAEGPAAPAGDAAEAGEDAGTEPSGQAVAVDPVALPEPAEDRDSDLDLLIDTLAGGDAMDDRADARPAPEAADSREPVAPMLSADEPDAEAPAAPDSTEPPSPIRARVVKVRRMVPGETPAASASGPAEDAAAEPAEVAGSSLTPEQEDDLARELAEVEREIRSRGPDAADASNPRSRKPRLEPVAAEEASVDRLLDQASSEIERPETRRRAATIAHLKAAVAATVAERSAAPAEKPAPDESEPYRDDLAQAVRPRRPVILPGTGTRRSDAPARVPPLVLVSEQRIDRVQPAAPVRPRRVTTAGLAMTDLATSQPGETEAEITAGSGADINIFGGDTEFSRFVERMDAADLPDLMEAAAAYVMVVEGRESFLRPQVTRLVTDYAGEDVSREDVLRCFGGLLRDGRIVKARRGSFVLADDSRLLAEARRKAG
ncbi:MAG: hypothetical protein ACK4KW_02920 [Gemmobacter sp.]